MTRKQFNARAFERELVDAGYMPLYEYIRRWGDEALSSRAAIREYEQFFDKLEQWLDTWANAAKPETNTGERADD